MMSSPGREAYLKYQDNISKRRNQAAGYTFQPQINKKSSNMATKIRDKSQSKGKNFIG